MYCTVFRWLLPASSAYFKYALSRKPRISRHFRRFATNAGEKVRLMKPAILLLEFESIAIGIRVGDAMTKRAPLKSLHTGTIHPGRYLVLAGGEVGDVEEARKAARETGAESLRDEVFLPDVHPAVVEALTGRRRRPAGAALGIFETHSVPAVIQAADRAVKGTEVSILEIRLADGLGGKGYVLLAGAVGDVTAAVDLAEISLDDPALLVARVVIPQLHGEMAANLADHAEFRGRIRGTEA